MKGASKESSRSSHTRITVNYFPDPVNAKPRTIFILKQLNLLDLFSREQINPILIWKVESQKLGNLNFKKKIGKKECHISDVKR